MRTCRDKDGTVPPSDKTLGSLRMGSGLRDVVLGPLRAALRSSRGWTNHPPRLFVGQGCRIQGLCHEGLLAIPIYHCVGENAGGSAGMTGGPVKALAGAVGTVAALAVTSPAQAVTGQDLLRQCEAL